MYKKTIVALIILGLTASTLMGSGLAKNSPTIVNVMIDADTTPNPNMTMVNIYYLQLINLSNVIQNNNLNATVFTTSEMDTSDRIGITHLQKLDNFEIALHGNKTGEDLSNMSEAEQDSLFAKEIALVNKCYICGGKAPNVKGFRPQLFKQNNDTFKVLNKYGFIWDAGFKAGVLYLPGHQNDVWPYPIPNYNLYAVPVSTYTLSSEKVYLYDRYLRDNKSLTADQWYNVLKGKFDEASSKGEPMVVIFSNRVSGAAGDYLDAYKRFIQYAMSENASFVTTWQLVNITKAGGIVPVSSSRTSPSSKCPDCESLKKGLASGPAVTVTISSPPENQTLPANSAKNTTKK